jgi:hypothetical protein
VSTLSSIAVIFRAGADVDAAAADLVSLANLTYAKCSGMFNGTLMVARPKDSVREVASLWDETFRARGRELERRTEEARLDRIERKLDWLHDIAVRNHLVTAGIKPEPLRPWPGPTPTPTSPEGAES